MSQPSQAQYGRQSQPQYGYDGGYPQQGPPPQQGPGRFYTPGPNGIPPGKIRISKGPAPYLQQQTLAPQSHSIRLKMDRNHFHMPLKLKRPNCINRNIQVTILATEYHLLIRVRPHPTLTPIAPNQPTTIRKNSLHLPMQVPQTPGHKRTHLIPNHRSPKANTHPPFTLLQMASSTDKRSSLNHHMPANRLLTLTLRLALLLHKTITHRTTKRHLHNHRLKRHRLAWVRTHIQSSTRGHPAGTRHTTLRRRNSSQGLWLRRKGTQMISIGNGWQARRFGESQYSRITFSPSVQPKPIINEAGLCYTLHFLLPKRMKRKHI